MKKFLYIIFAGVLFIGCEPKKVGEIGKEFHIHLSSTNDLADFLKNEKYPLVSAHRGGPIDGFAENSIEAFKNTIQYGPSIIETDIAMTKDSVLILMHDDQLERTTTGKGYVNNYTYSQLQAFSLKDVKGKIIPNKIPTLDEALKWGKNKVIFTLDVKRGVPYEKVIESITKQNAEANSIVITYNANQAKAFHKLNKNIWLSVSANGKEDINRLKTYKVNTNQVVTFVGVTVPLDETISYFNNLNIPIILGTMGNLDNSAKASKGKLYNELFSKGITILSSKNAKLVSEEALKVVYANKIQSKYIQELKK